MVGRVFSFFFSYFLVIFYKFHALYNRPRPSFPNSPALHFTPFIALPCKKWNTSNPFLSPTIYLYISAFLSKYPFTHSLPPLTEPLTPSPAHNFPLVLPLLPTREVTMLNFKRSGQTVYEANGDNRVDGCIQSLYLTVNLTNQYMFVKFCLIFVDQMPVFTFEPAECMHGSHSCISSVEL